MLLRYLLIVMLVASEMTCQPSPPSPPARGLRVTAALDFTKRYASSRFAGWKIRAEAAGNDCDVLFVQAGVIMEDSMVEALHYGAGAYGVVEGGVQRFSRDRSFRAVAYKDSSGRIWPYGVTEAEARTLRPCG